VDELPAISYSRIPMIWQLKQELKYGTPIVSDPDDEGWHEVVINR
jgi:hypothetical protein